MLTELTLVAETDVG